VSAPSKLSNDCFALPAGVHWTPVSEALRLLEQRLQCCVPVEQSAVEQSDGRILAHAVIAARSHPPCANSAVDGYAFAGGLQAGAQSLQLRDGRSALKLKKLKLKLFGTHLGIKQKCQNRQN